jgi:hypothetical protein
VNNFFIALALLIIFFAGEPDLQDAIIRALGTY